MMVRSSTPHPAGVAGGMPATSSGRTSGGCFRGGTEREANLTVARRRGFPHVRRAGGKGADRMIAAPDVSYRTFKVWQRNRDVFMHIWKAEMIWPVFEPLIVMLGLGLGLGKFVELESGQEYIQFIAPGTMAAFVMWGTIAEAGWASYNRMENQKTFAAMIATPVSIDDVISGDVIWAATTV